MKKIDWTLLILIISTFVIGFYLYPKLPELMPIHWNIKGEVDSYGSKLLGTFLLPAINLFLFPLLLILPKIDPRTENYQKFTTTYIIIRYTLHLFLILIFFVTMYQSLKTTEDGIKFLEIDFIVPFTTSILIIILGNYLGKIKDNFFVGVRTPWTLSSKDVWYKTHRLTSKLFVASGILGIIGSLIGGYLSFILLLIPLLISSIIAVVYSYFAYQKELKH